MGEAEMSGTTDPTAARDRATLVTVSNTLTNAMGILANAIQQSQVISDQIAMQNEYNTLNNISHMVTQALMVLDDQLFISATTSLKAQATTLMNVQNRLNQIAQTVGTVSQVVAFVIQAAGFLAAL
jgi:hypothetical protein